jgi:hypothetical protein
MRKRSKLAYMAALGLSLAGCASSPKGMLEKPVIQTYESAKTPAVLADCFAQSLRIATISGNDGRVYWVTRENAFGSAVRFDFIPSEKGGSIVEYRSRIRINNGLDKLRACL